MVVLIKSHAGSSIDHLARLLVPPGVSGASDWCSTLRVSDDGPWSETAIRPYQVLLDGSDGRLIWVRRDRDHSIRVRAAQYYNSVEV